MSSDGLGRASRTIYACFLGTNCATWSVGSGKAHNGSGTGWSSVGGNFTESKERKQSGFLWLFRTPPLVISTKRCRRDVTRCADPRAAIETRRRTRYFYRRALGFFRFSFIFRLYRRVQLFFSLLQQRTSGRIRRVQPRERATGEGEGEEATRFLESLETDDVFCERTQE